MSYGIVVLLVAVLIAIEALGHLLMRNEAAFCVVFSKRCINNWSGFRSRSPSADGRSCWG